MAGPSPIAIFDMMNAYQKSAALKGAVELRIFTLIGEGKTSAAEIAAASGADTRGVGILCDYLVVAGMLTKKDGRYGNTQDTAFFLDEKSPACMGGAVGFLNSAQILETFSDIAATVRKGGTIAGPKGTTEHGHTIWEKFAKAMGGLTGGQAMPIAAMLCGETPRPMRVLDVSASHGLFGIMAAKKNPQAVVVGLDWENVLPMARENAKRMGVGDRYETIAGDAFSVDLKGPYDAILLPNLLHHFDFDACVTLLKRMHAATRPGGTMAIVEFVVNEDRVTPPASGAFALVMLASTPKGDVYTLKQYRAMLEQAGFKNAEQRDIGVGVQQVIFAEA